MSNLSFWFKLKKRQKLRIFPQGPDLSKKSEKRAKIDVAQIGRNELRWSLVNPMMSQRSTEVKSELSVQVEKTSKMTDFSARSGPVKKNRKNRQKLMSLKLVEMDSYGVW